MSESAIYVAAEAKRNDLIIKPNSIIECSLMNLLQIFVESVENLRKNQI